MSPQDEFPTNKAKPLWPRLVLASAGMVLLLVGVALFGWAENQKSTMFRNMMLDYTQSASEYESRISEFSRNAELTRQGQPTVVTTPTNTKGTPAEDSFMAAFSNWSGWSVFGCLCVSAGGVLLTLAGKGTT